MLYARIVFGASAILSGVVSAMWRDSSDWQRLAGVPSPLGATIVWILVIAQIAGGIGMMFPRTARVASVVLGIAYGFFALACVPQMIRTPKDPGQYVDFFEQLAIVCGALAVYAPTATRLGLGACALSFAWAQAVFSQYTASLVPTWIPPNQMFWTILTTIAFALAGIAILINRLATLAMRLMALMMALFGVLVWVPHLIAAPRDLSQWNELAANYLITAATWLVADAQAMRRAR